MQGLLHVLLALIFGLGGAGAGGSASSSESGSRASGQTEETLIPHGPALHAPEIEPHVPPIVLEAAGGVQEATAAEYSLHEKDGSSSGQSAGMGPISTMVVHPGDAVSVSMRGVGPTQRVIVARKGSCDGDAAAVVFLDRGERRWHVDLAPGDYVLEVRVLRFRTSAGSGEQTGMLGLRVDPDAERSAADSISCFR